METYKTYITVDKSGQVILSNLPFKQGEKLEIDIRTVSDEDSDDKLLDRWKTLLKKTQQLHADNPLTEEDIQSDIDNSREGK